jgi:hypothetical protein
MDEHAEAEVANVDFFQHYYFSESGGTFDDYNQSHGKKHEAPRECVKNIRGVWGGGEFRFEA